ncbi:MAG: hypothetical protein ACI823_000661, partial [Chitinophagales bacterium]
LFNHLFIMASLFRYYRKETDRQDQKKEAFDIITSGFF